MFYKNDNCRHYKKKHYRTIQDKKKPKTPDFEESIKYVRNGVEYAIRTSFKLVQIWENLDGWQP